MKRIVGFYIILSLCFGLNAQNDQVGATTQYKPNLMDAKKMLIDPRVPKNTGSEIELTYNPEQFKYYTNPAVSLAPPTKYVDPTLDTSYNPNYLRLGAGNYGHKLGEIYIANRANSKWAYGLSGQHLSADQSSSIRDFSNNKGYLWGSRFFGRSSMTARMHYLRDMYRFYGFDTSKIKEITEQPRKIGTNVGGSVLYDMKSLKNKPGFSVGVDFNNYHNTLKQSELEYGAKLGWDFKVSELKIFGDLNFTQLNYRQNFKTTNQSIIAFNPRAQFINKENDVDAIIGFNLSHIFGNKDPFINPVIHAEKKLEGLKMLVYGGVNGGLKLNSVRRFASTVPFTSDSIAIKNSFEEIKGYVGLKGKITENTQFMVEFGGNSMADMPLIVSNNDTLNSSNLVYTNVSNIFLVVDLRVSLGEKFRFGGNGTLNNYEAKGETQAYGLPLAKYGVSAQYLWNKMLVFDLGIDGIGKWYNKQLVSNRLTEIDGYLDLHARVDYRFKDIARFWVQATNLLNQKYQRFFGYNVYGTTVMAGISASF